jgi:hypothetical protein
MARKRDNPDPDVPISVAASALGRKGRAVNSPAQQQAARDNGKRGGRPKGSVRKAIACRRCGRVHASPQEVATCLLRHLAKR